MRRAKSKVKAQKAKGKTGRLGFSTFDFWLLRFDF
jgi:hypothetical protein